MPRSRLRPQLDQKLSRCLSDLLLFELELRVARCFVRSCARQMSQAELPPLCSRFLLARASAPHSQIRRRESAPRRQFQKFLWKLRLPLAPALLPPRSPRFLPALHPSASCPWEVLPEPPPSHLRCSPPPYRRLPCPIPRPPCVPAPARQRCANPDSRRYKSPDRLYSPPLPSFSSLMEMRSGSSIPHLLPEAHSGRGSIAPPPQSPAQNVPASMVPSAGQSCLPASTMHLATRWLQKA